MIKNKKIIEAISYVLSKKDFCFSKLKLVKLLFIADKTHLEDFGRTITEDRFVAMKKGPVGSKTLDFLNAKFENEDQKDYFNSLILEKTKNVFCKAKNKCTFKALSETDREVLDMVVSTFAELTEEKLVDFLHTFPEWKKHEEFLKQNPRSCKDIPLSDIIEKPVFLNISKARLMLSKDIFLGD